MKPTRILDRWELLLPDHLADWDVWDYWERDRLGSIIANVELGDCLVDVGAEQGALSALIASATNARMCLVEPEPRAWRCIREIWEANDLPAPAGLYAGLFGPDVDNSPKDLNFATELKNGWPACSYMDRPCEARAYRYLHEHSNNTPRSTLDAWKPAGLKVDALTIDVEGAELEVLKGAQDTIRFDRPLIWASVHPDLLERDYGATVDEVFYAIERWRYERVWLGTDHEEHHFFWPVERTVSL